MSEEIPAALYRVYSSESQSFFNPVFGFQAMDREVFRGQATEPLSLDKATMVHALKNHLDWGSRVPSPFVSTTSSYSKALILAKSRRMLGQTVFIARICAAKILRTSLPYRHLPPYNAKRLAQALGVWDEIDFIRQSSVEWLVPSTIPLRAVDEIRRFTKGASAIGL